MSADVKWSLAECRERVRNWTNAYHQRMEAGHDRAILLALVDAQAQRLERMRKHIAHLLECEASERGKSCAECDAADALLREIAGGGE